MKALVAMLATAAVGAASATDTTIRVDPRGDAAARPTTLTQGFNASALPDVLEFSIGGWAMAVPGGDPYAGVPADGDAADLFRLELVFDGLVNPPGPLGLGASSWDPFRYGDRPAYGFVELNIDRDRDTGGELGAAARNRYLANAGRFGRRTSDSIGGRLAESGDDIDADFFSPPFFERSGAEFDFGFCGCFDTTLVAQTGDMDSVMDAGETFIVRGRFFRRVAAFASVSGMEGGSFGGLYDPMVEARFAHDATSDRTTLTFVGALTMAGASELTGEPEQIADFLVDNHWSVYEAVFDIIDGALGFNGPIGPEVGVLINEWADSTPGEHLDPTRWRVLGLFGGTYTTQGPELFVWSDTGFEETERDFNGDAFADENDRDELAGFVASFDGSPSDADGTSDGRVTLPDPGQNFSLYDLNGDFLVDDADLEAFESDVFADLTGDGAVDGGDLAVLLAAWGPGSGPADLSGDGVVNSTDLAALLAVWGD